MDWPLFFSRMMAPARPAAVILCALGVLMGLTAAPHWLNKKSAAERVFQQRLISILDQVHAARERFASREMLKRMDLEQLKAGLSGNAQTQKSLYESGLSLQEERRLLEKQLEIMTTYLMVDPSLQRVFLMKDEQPLQSYLMTYFPSKQFGPVQANLPGIVRIVSKERFAHPERGKSEEVNGRLQWVPPQVGTSVRSNALGEFVMFTNSALILHGPPLNPDDHERFPHICLGLGREAARKLYRGSFIGTKIVVRDLPVEKAVLQPLPSGTTTGP